jgi:choline dehydrogenase-like flavoprotein
MRVDVVVIGSGAGGAAVAGELARAGRDVMVVEAGPVRFGTPGLHARNLDTSEAALPEFGRRILQEWVFPANAQTPLEGLPGMAISHGVGGMFGIWCSNCPRPDRSELPDWMPTSVWDTYLARAESVMHIHRNIAEGGVRASRIQAATARAVGRLEAGREVQPMPIAVRRVDGALKYTGSDDLLAVGEDETPPSLLADHVVRRIEHRDGRASAVVAVPRQGGAELRIEADTVVVAAGTLASAQLVQASGLDAGPALGRYLLDHPIVSTRVLLKPEILADVPAGDPLFSVWVPHSATHPWQNEVFRFPQDPPAGTRDEDGADVTTFVSMDVNPDNRLVFDADALDNFGLPRVKVALKHSRADHRRIADATAENYMISAAVADLSHGWNPVMYKPGGSAHLMGSCRMGPKDDGESVVNQSGRLWRSDNVYVAGNAVLGTSSGANPTFTTVAAALMTADAILGR